MQIFSSDCWLFLFLNVYKEDAQKFLPSHTAAFSYTHFLGLNSVFSVSTPHKAHGDTLWFHTVLQANTHLYQVFKYASLTFITVSHSYLPKISECLLSCLPAGTISP